jgi:hypothetical protein
MNEIIAYVQEIDAELLLLDRRRCELLDERVVTNRAYVLIQSREWHYWRGTGAAPADLCRTRTLSWGKAECQAYCQKSGGWHDWSFEGMTADKMEEMCVTHREWQPITQAEAEAQIARMEGTKP